MFDQLSNQFQYSRSSPEEFPILDLNEWNEYVEAIANLGFEQIVDFRVESILGISRLFANSKDRVFAEIFKVLSFQNEPLPIELTFYSSFSDGWRLCSTTSKPNGISYVWRSPKNIVTYYSGIETSDLLKIHIIRQQQIADDLGLTILADISWEAYCAERNALCLKRRQIFERKNIVFAFIEATLFELNPKNEWLGDYPKLAAQRKARGL